MEPDPRSLRWRRTDGRRDRRHGIGLLILALAAFVPMLASRPGRLILDTHDGLHLDPAGTLATAASRWDPIGALGMFADKTYDYTFPMSQWFWFGDRIGLPMWLTHRLWIGLLLFAAGTGVVFLLRTMNWTEQSWLLAALAYQCSPYVLLYAGSRSTVLLAWAALPWLIAFTMRSLVDTGWRSPAWCAVIVALIGPGNVPATIYVALACLTWFLYATVATKDVGWRDALVPFGRIASLCTIVSVWWLTSLLIDFERDVRRPPRQRTARQRAGGNPGVGGGAGARQLAAVHLGRIERHRRRHRPATVALADRRRVRAAGDRDGGHGAHSLPVPAVLRHPLHPRCRAVDRHLRTRGGRAVLSRHAIPRRPWSRCAPQPLEPRLAPVLAGRIDRRRGRRPPVRPARPEGRPTSHGSASWR